MRQSMKITPLNLWVEYTVSGDQITIEKVRREGVDVGDIIPGAMYFEIETYIRKMQ